MQLRRNILLALMIVMFVYFQVHSCSQDAIITPEPTAETPASMLLGATDVYFYDHDHGWVAGQKGTLIQTTDGGDTWTAALAGEYDIRSVYFLDPDTGWVVGNNGRLHRSLDGGRTWERMIFTGYPQDDNLLDVRFVDEEHGFILGYSGVFVTKDGGIGWENNWLPVVTYCGAWSMSIIDYRTAFLLGSRWSETDPELIYRSDDGGVSWSSVPGSNSSMLPGVVTIFFIDGGTGWAAGGTIMKTTDGGSTWETQLETTTVRRMFFFDAVEGFAVGRASILHTDDGGTSWNDVSPRDDRIADLRSIYFVDRLHGWVVGRGGEEMIGGRTFRYSVVLATVDGGVSWNVSRFAWDATGLVSAACDGSAQ